MSLDLDRTAGESGHISDHNIIHELLNTSVVNVKASPYNAVGDNVTDDTAAIQAAIDAVPGGGVVYFPEGMYKVSTGLTSSAPNLELRGQGGGVGQSNALGAGLASIRLVGSIVGFTFNPSASTTIFQGPIIRHMHFRKGSGTPTGGILLKRTSNWLLDNVSCSDYTTGYGFYSDGTGDINQYGQLHNYRCSNCLIGYDSLLTNGVNLFGGYIDGSDNSASAPANSIGIRFSGDTCKAFGTNIQGVDKGVYLAGSDHGLYGCRFEVFGTYAIDIQGIRAQVKGGSIDNFLMGGTGTGINVQASADNAQIEMPNITSVATTIADAGTSTVIHHAGSITIPGRMMAGGYANALAPTGALQETLPRQLSGSSAAIGIASQTVKMVAISLPKGLLITSITFMAGTTPLASGVHQVFGLYDSSRNLLRGTSDDTSTAWAASTKKTLNLTSTFTTTYAGLHYLAILVDASTPPTLVGWSEVSEAMGLTPIIFGNSSTGRTTLPNPGAALTAGGAYAYAYVS